MAHHKSAEKRIRRNERRTIINRNRRSRVRTFVKKVERAIAAGDLEAARTAFAQAEPELARGANRGVVPARTAARKVGRLAQALKRLHEQQQAG